jgi:hypothetical protein
MNRLYYQFRLALEKRIVDLFGKVTIAGSGAPTLVAASSKGIASISRASAGLYNITLQDKYVGLLNVQIATMLAAGAPDAVGGWIIRSEAVATTKVIQVLFVDGAGAAIDPDDGATLFLTIQLKATTV